MQLRYLRHFHKRAVYIIEPIAVTKIVGVCQKAGGSRSVGGIGIQFAFIVHALWGTSRVDTPYLGTVLRYSANNHSSFHEKPQL